MFRVKCPICKGLLVIDTRTRRVVGHTSVEDMGKGADERFESIVEGMEKAKSEQEKKLEAFRDSLNLARSVLALVAGGTHARWSRSLNAAASAIVEGLTEGRYSSVTFGDDLSPAVERPDGRQVMEGQLLQECLSEGTQDLLYFAARVAVAKELSSTKEPLPLILDDPLVAFDDDRRARVLSLLAKTAREVQVIAFTCREEYAPELRVLCEKEGVSFSCIRL